jgi:hypothetical protein
MHPSFRSEQQTTSKFSFPTGSDGGSSKNPLLLDASSARTGASSSRRSGRSTGRRGGGETGGGTARTGQSSGRSSTSRAEQSRVSRASSRRSNRLRVPLLTFFVYLFPQFSPIISIFPHLRQRSTTKAFRRSVTTVPKKRVIHDEFDYRKYARDVNR